MSGGHSSSGRSEGDRAGSRGGSLQAKHRRRSSPSDAYGFGYVQALAQGFYGITDAACIKAEGLDIIGADVEKILSEAKATIDEVA